MTAIRSAYFCSTTRNSCASDLSCQYPFSRYRRAKSGGKGTTPSSIVSSWKCFISGCKIDRPWVAVAIYRSAIFLVILMNMFSLWSDQWSVNEIDQPGNEGFPTRPNGIFCSCQKYDRDLK